MTKYKRSSSSLISRSRVPCLQQEAVGGDWTCLISPQQNSSCAAASVTDVLAELCFICACLFVSIRCIWRQFTLCLPHHPYQKTEEYSVTAVLFWSSCCNPCLILRFNHFYHFTCCFYALCKVTLCIYHRDVFMENVTDNIRPTLIPGICFADQTWLHRVEPCVWGRQLE